jgi:hypothetical protein
LGVHWGDPEEEARILSDIFKKKDDGKISDSRSFMLRLLWNQTRDCQVSALKRGVLVYSVPLLQERQSSVVSMEIHIPEKVLQELKSCETSKICLTVKDTKKIDLVVLPLGFTPV